MASKLVETLAIIVCYGCAFGGFYFGIVAMVNIYRASAERKPGVSPFLTTGLFWVMFYPERYTDAGLIARRHCIRGLVGFLICLVICALVGLTTGVLH